MVRIRLTRLGKHKDPFYRIVATDSRTKRDGGYLALIGTYEPFAGKVVFNSKVAIKFLNSGAIPSETVLNLMKQQGLYKQYLIQKKTVKKAKKHHKSANKAVRNKERMARKANKKVHSNKPAVKTEEKKVESATANIPEQK